MAGILWVPSGWSCSGGSRDGVPPGGPGGGEALPGDVAVPPVALGCLRDKLLPSDVHCPGRVRGTVVSRCSWLSCSPWGVRPLSGPGRIPGREHMGSGGPIHAAALRTTSITWTATTRRWAEDGRIEKAAGGTDDGGSAGTGHPGEDAGRTPRTSSSTRRPSSTWWPAWWSRWSLPPGRFRGCSRARTNSEPSLSAGWMRRSSRSGWNGRTVRSFSSW